MHLEWYSPDGAQGQFRIERSLDNGNPKVLASVVSDGTGHIRYEDADVLPGHRELLWWTLALGKFTWAAGALPAVDPLPYTATPVPYVQAQWLAALLLYGTYRLGGFELLLVLRAAIVAAAFALLYVGCRRAGAAPPLAGLASLLALPLVNVGLSLRPQLFALVPFLLYLEATRRPALGPRARYALPLVMVFWANVHGSFMFRSDSPKLSTIDPSGLVTRAFTIRISCLLGE